MRLSTSSHEKLIYGRGESRCPVNCLPAAEPLALNIKYAISPHLVELTNAGAGGARVPSVPAVGAGQSARKAQRARAAARRPRALEVRRPVL